MKLLLSDLPHILIGELKRTTDIFLAWVWDSKMSESAFTGKNSENSNFLAGVYNVYFLELPPPPWGLGRWFGRKKMKNWTSLGNFLMIFDTLCFFPHSANKTIIKSINKFWGEKNFKKRGGKKNDVTRKYTHPCT